MSVASKNAFALLDEDGSNQPAPEPAPTVARTDQPSTRGGQRGGRGSRGGPGSRGGKYYPRGGPRTSAPREGAEDDGADDSSGKKVEPADGVRGRGRGRGGRGRGDREGSRGGRRTYDRHSATGKTDSEKKIHQSWGGDEGQTEFATETAAANDAAAEGAPPAENWAAGGGGETDWAANGGGDNTDWAAGGGDTDWAAGGGGDAEWAPAPATTTNAEEPAERSDRRPRERQEEEQENTLTLDQYLAQQKEKPTTIPQLEPRKIQQDEGLWKGATELVKGAEEVSYFVGKTKSTPKARTKKAEKEFLEIDARFERPSRGGRGRGDRGDRGGERERGGRGRGRGHGGGRGGRSNGTPALNVGDESDFPSLS